MSKFIYTKDKPLKVFTAFSGYDSQCMALDRLGIPYELVGWSEIDKYAIQAHNAVYPQYADRNAGDISKIDWGGVTNTITGVQKDNYVLEIYECREENEADSQGLWLQKTSAI